MMNRSNDYMGHSKPGTDRMSTYDVGADTRLPSRRVSDSLRTALKEEEKNNCDHVPRGRKRPPKSMSSSVGLRRSERILGKLQPVAPMTRTVALETGQQDHDKLQIKRKLGKSISAHAKRSAIKSRDREITPQVHPTNGRFVSEKENGDSNTLQTIIPEQVGDLAFHHQTFVVPADRKRETINNLEGPDYETHVVGAPSKGILAGPVVALPSVDTEKTNGTICRFVYLVSGFAAPPSALQQGSSVQSSPSVKQNVDQSMSCVHKESWQECNGKVPSRAASLDASVQLPRDASYLFSPVGEDAEARVARCKFHVRKFSCIDYYDAIAHCLEPYYKQLMSFVVSHDEPVFNDITDQDMVDFLEDVLWTGGQDHVELIPLIEIQTPDYGDDEVNNILTFPSDPSYDIWVE